MNTTITITHDDGRKETEYFSIVTAAVRYAESVVKNEGHKLTSVLMQGPEGEREFLQENTTAD